MRRRSPTGSCLIAGLALPGLAACWSQPISVETESLRLAAPPAPPPPRQEPARPVTQEPLAPEIRLPEPKWRAPRARRLVLPTGLPVIAHADPRPRVPVVPARLRVLFAGGARTEARPGLSRLALRALVEQPGEGRPSLRRALQEAGGDVEVRVGPHTVQLDVIAPAAHWADALAWTLEALRRPPAGRDLVERARSAVVRSLRARAERRDLDGLIDHVTLRGGRGAAEWLAAVEDLDEQVVADWRRTRCRPDRAALLLWVPGADPRAVLERARALGLPWRAPGAAQGPRAEREPPEGLAPDAVQPGLSWAPAPNAPATHAAILVPRPTPGTAEALYLDLCLEILAVDGAGGRLAQKLSTQLGFSPWLHARTLRFGLAEVATLRATPPSREAFAMWRATLAARDDLVERPPDRREVESAAARLRLRLWRAHADPAAWMDMEGPLALAGKGPLDWQDLLDRLGAASPGDLALARRVLARWPIAMVVLGGAPPAEAESVARRVENAFVSPFEPVPPERLEARLRAATGYVDRAVEALGGFDRLAALQGYVRTATLTSELGASLRERVWFRAPDRLRRLRRILQTRVETVVAGERAFERAGDRRVMLEAPERERLLDAARRHPLLLMAAAARGEVQFQLLALRRSGDRRLAVLERVDPTRSVLRVFVDTGSGLPRRIETKEWQPGLRTAVRVSAEFFDYRSAGGLRVPFFVRITVDGRPGAILERVESFEPRTPSDEELGG